MKRSILLVIALMFALPQTVQEISVGITVNARQRLSVMWQDWNGGRAIHCACLYGQVEPLVIQAIMPGWELNSCQGEGLLGAALFLKEVTVTNAELDWMACGLQSLYGWEVAAILASERVLEMGVCVKDPNAARWRDNSEES